MHLGGTGVTDDVQESPPDCPTAGSVQLQGVAMCHSAPADAQSLRYPNRVCTLPPLTASHDDNDERPGLAGHMFTGDSCGCKLLVAFLCGFCCRCESWHSSLSLFRRRRRIFSQVNCGTVNICKQAVVAEDTRLAVMPFWVITHHRPRSH